MLLQPAHVKLAGQARSLLRGRSAKGAISTSHRRLSQPCSTERPSSQTRAMAGASAAAEPLWDNVLRAYAHGQTSGAAISLHAEPRLVADSASGLEFVIRIAEALNKKPTLADVKKTETKNADGEKRPAHNPFLPYNPDLYVQHLPPKHVLLLNKFNVVANHMLVVTQDFEHQNDPLNEADMAVTLQVLRAMPGEGGLAFYNCGEASGHSQPHKHIQIVPLPLSELRAGPPPVEGSILAAAAEAKAAPGEPFLPATLPFRGHCALLQPEASAKEVVRAYDQLKALSSKEASSYNMLLTPRWMMIVPRRHEQLGNVGVNALGFVGTILVRSKEDFDELVRVGPGTVLAETGVATSTHGAATAAAPASAAAGATVDGSSSGAAVAS